MKTLLHNKRNYQLDEDTTYIMGKIYFKPYSRYVVHSKDAQITQQQKLSILKFNIFKNSIFFKKTYELPIAHEIKKTKL